VRLRADAIEAPETVEEPEGAAFRFRELVDLAKQRRMLIFATMGVAVALALVYTLLQTPVFRATSELLIDPTTLQVVGRDIVRADTSASIDLANVDSQQLVIVSAPVLQQVAEDLHLEDDPYFKPKPGLFSRRPGDLSHDQLMAEIVEALKRAIVVHRVEATLVFQIVVSHPNAEQAARIANQVAVAYLARGNEVRSNSVSRANATLVSQIAGLKHQLSEAETAVETFRSQNGLIATDTGLIVTQQLKDLYTQITLANTELARQAARKDDAAKFSSDPALADALPDALTSPTMLALRAQYAQTAQTAASLAQSLMPQHPRMREIEAQLKETRHLMSAELNRVKLSIRKSYEQAQANVANLQARANEIAKTQSASGEALIKLRQLESEAEAIRSVYNASLARAKELEQQQTITTNNSRLLSKAVPPLKASKPPVLLVLPAAGMFGAIAGLAIAYLLELMPKFRKSEGLTARDIDAIFDAPLIVFLPRLPPQWRRSLAETAQSTSEIARRFGPLTENLRGHFSGRSSVVIAIADLGTGAGQTVLQSLSQSLHAAGENVLLCEGTVKGVLQVKRLGAEPPKREPRRLDRAGRWQQAGERQPFQTMKRERRSTLATHIDEFLIAPLEEVAHISGGIADAIILVIDPAKTSPEDLREHSIRIDPDGERLAALVMIEKAHDAASVKRLREAAVA